MITKFIDSFVSCSRAFSQIRHDVHSLNIGSAAAAGNDRIIALYTRPVRIREFCDASSNAGDGFVVSIEFFPFAFN